jgi:predicted acetyltransferase
MELVWPSPLHLPSYVAALERGWSPDHSRGAAATADELAAIQADPVAFIAGMIDREAKGPPVALPDGTTVPRLPGYHRWMWDDGGFCGSIDFRWSPGTTALPPYCLGHIGYAVVAWKQRRGYATRALGLLLAQSQGEGLPFVELTTDVGNLASRRVIEANGGKLVETFTKPAQFGFRPGLRYRIETARSADAQP